MIEVWVVVTHLPHVIQKTSSARVGANLLLSSLADMLDSLYRACCSWLYHKFWPVCAMCGLAVHQFVKVKTYSGWIHTV